MAAVLCQGIGNCCTGCSQLLCVLPCKTCNTICSETCKGCTKVCSETCNGCTTICDTLGQCCTSPFMPYLTVTLLLNIPGIIYGILGITTLIGCSDEDDDNKGNTGSFVSWLIINGIVGVLHITASGYIVTQIRNDDTITATTGLEGEGIPDNDNVEGQQNQNPPSHNPESTQGQQQQQASQQQQQPTMARRLDGLQTILRIPNRNLHGTPDSCDRIKYVLCFDKWVAMYMILFVIWIIWLAIGMGRAWSSNDNNGSGGSQCDDDLDGYINISVTCGFLYVFSVTIAFGISLCCLLKS